MALGLFVLFALLLQNSPHLWEPFSPGLYLCGEEEMKELLNLSLSSVPAQLQAEPFTSPALFMALQNCS